MSDDAKETIGRNSLIVALMSVTLIGLELAWTRIFSAEFFYTFAFLVLSLAILGLGLGALVLRLFPALDRRGLVGVYLSLSGLTALVGPVLIFRLGLDFSLVFGSVGMAFRFVAAVLLLGSAYFFGGLALASLFKRNHAEVPRLYMADLIGAAAGVLGIIWLMNSVGTPAATVLCAIPIFAAAFLAGPGWMRGVSAVLALGAVLLTPYASGLLEARREERAPVIYKHWDALAKLKVYDFGGHYRGLNIDNVANSPVIPFDGNFDDPELEDAQWGIDVSNLIDRFDGCTFLSLGAGGGGDVLQALVEGASVVHAVEVNPHINRMMTTGDPSGYIEVESDEVPPPEETAASSESSAEAVETTAEKAEAEESTEESAETDESESEAAAEAEAPQAPPAPVIRNAEGEIITLAEYSGRIYDDPRVQVVTEDARTYVQRHEGTFDLIYSLSSNTWAALGSGAFALAETYLFTVGAYEDYWRSLTDEGFLSMEHQVYMPRLVSAVLQALENQGVADPAAHIAVYDLPQMRRKLLLLSKQPLTDEIRNNAYGELTEENYEAIHLLYPAPESLEDNLINRIVTEGWKSVAATAPIDISPSTDDRPFTAQTGLWRNFKWEDLKNVVKWAEFRGFPLSKCIIVTILLIVGVIVLPLNLLPFLRKNRSFGFVPWMYFFSIGLAFMAVEVVLIQKYTLTIGASVYSIATVLLTLLLTSGLGSGLSRRFSDTTAFTGIVVCLLLHAFVLGAPAHWVAELSLLPRVLVTVLSIAPLGFFMGMPFPKGALRVGESIDWGFAVNGAASVLGATVIVLVALSWGFTVALSIGALLYALAYGLLRLTPGTSSA